MEFFAVLVFLALGVMALTMLGERGYRRLREGRAAIAVGWGIGLAWLANLNMWTSWHVITLRWDWVGVTLTGLAAGGAALLLYAVLGFFAGLFRKFDDEADVIEHRERELHRVA